MRLSATKLGSIANSRSFGDQLADLAGQVPGLDLNFARNKSLIDDYSGTSLVTFTRASTGTFVGSDGVLQTAATDAPRFDHNPTTGESLGLLVEEARTNTCLQSQAITISAPWSHQGTTPTIATNAFTAPDGTTTATRVTFAAADSRVTQGSISLTSGTTYTLSLYARPVTPGTLNVFRLAVYDGANQLNGNDIALVAGWQRVSFTFTSSFTGSGAGINIRNSSAANVANDVYLWGAQLEAGAFPTSYIPTTTATVTRAADVASITGSNFSSWYNQTEGTICSVATATSSTNTDATATAVGIAAFTDGTNAERIRHGALTFLTVWIDNNTSQASLSSGAFTQNQQVNLASAFKLNDFALVRDGGSVQTDATGTLPTLTQVEFGRSGVGTGFFTGTIKRLTYWPTRLSNPALQSITTP